MPVVVQFLTHCKQNSSQKWTKVYCNYLITLGPVSCHSHVFTYTLTSHLLDTMINARGLCCCGMVCGIDWYLVTNFLEQCIILTFKCQAIQISPLKMGPIGCPKKSVTYYQSLPCSSPEEQRLPVHLLGSLISCMINASSKKFSDSNLVLKFILCCSLLWHQVYGYESANITLSLKMKIRFPITLVPTHITGCQDHSIELHHSENLRSCI
jgi:hypothetical protein